MHPSPGITARAVVNRIIDGDTLDVELHIPVRIRLLDCYAPELRGAESELGHAAKHYLQRLAPDGLPVVCHIPTGHAENVSHVLSFGRVLGQVWPMGGDLSFSELMVSGGHATSVHAKRTGGGD